MGGAVTARSGWVPIPRALRDSLLWPRRRKFTDLEAYLDLRLRAAFRQTALLVGHREVTVRPGEILTSQVDRVSQGYVAQMEGGVSKNPSLAVLQRLAKALGVKVGRLLE